MTFIDLRDRYGITQLVFNSTADSLLFDAANRLGREYCIQVVGRVSERESKNPKMDTGEIEILAERLQILSPSLTPPFTTHRRRRPNPTIWICDGMPFAVTLNCATA